MGPFSIQITHSIPLALKKDMNIFEMNIVNKHKDTCLLFDIEIG